MTDISPTPKTPKAKAARQTDAASQTAAPSLNNTATPPPAPPAPPNPPPNPLARHVSLRVMRIALAVSVALNLAILGVVAGSFLHQGGGMGGRGEMGRDLGFGPFGEALAPDDRRVLRDWLKARAPELRTANSQRYADLTAVQAALRAQPFDPAALRAAFEAMRGRMEDQLALGHQALTEVILAMPDAQRLALADRLERGMQRGREGGGKGGEKAGGN